MRFKHEGRRSILALAALATVAAAFTAGTVTSRVRPQDTADWMKYCKPCMQHDILDQLAGEWRTTVRTWETPDSEPVVNEGGTATYRWKLGGRFLMGDLSAYAGGEEIEAIQTIGYDNFRGEFREVWIDDRSNQMQLSTGQYDAAEKAIVWTGSSDNLVTGERDQPFRFVMRFIDDDTWEYEVYRPDESGEMYKRAVATFERWY